MATSKSNKAPKKWTAGASIFSGRRDPTWTVPKALALQLEKIWDSLESSSEEPSGAPPLGYRGCFLKDPSGREWLAYGNAVKLTTDSGSELRHDKERSFEKLCLRSAPARVLPPEILHPRRQ